MIQVVCKMGGAPWMVKFPVKGTLTAGFDVSHGKNSKKSYGAFVASMDLQKAVKYYSGVVEHNRGEEISGQLGVQIRMAMQTYVKMHDTLPERVMFYRDGVGKGQHDAVLDTEIASVREVLEEFYKNAGKPFPPFTFILVNKRLNTRFFMKVNGQTINPDPGTVVDDVVTSPDVFDFFLVSQSVRLGTVTPTMYTVLDHPELDLDPGKLQWLTWKNCHLYYNWSGKFFK